MEWFRHYHGLSTDPKLTVVAMTADVSHCTAVAAWCFALEHASGAAQRGSAVGLSAKVMAIGLRITLAEAGRLIEAFKSEGLIDADDMVTAWDKRQRPSDNGAERVRAWRAKRDIAGSNATETKAVTLQPEPETLPEPTCNVTVQAREEQSRTEQKEEGAPEPLGRPAKAALWAEMKAQIGGKSAGSLVGSWCRDYGDAEVIAAHFAAMSNPPAQYVEWMVGRLKARKRQSLNGSHAPPTAAKVSHDEQLRRREAEQQVLAEGMSPHTAEGRNRITQIMGSANGHRSAA